MKIKNLLSSVMVGITFVISMTSCSSINEELVLSQYPKPKSVLIENKGWNFTEMDSMIMTVVVESGFDPGCGVRRLKLGKSVEREVDSFGIIKNLVCKVTPSLQEGNIQLLVEYSIKKDYTFIIATIAFAVILAIIAVCSYLTD
jgi:hypothetical protein